MHESIAGMPMCGSPDESLQCSRELPSPQAIVQRRRAWLEQQKMIVFLTAIDLIGMLEMREKGEEPFDVIDAQLEDFFRKLSP